MDPAVLGFALPAGPLQVGESHGGLQGEWFLVDLGARNGDRRRDDRAPTRIGNQKPLGGGFDRDVGGVREPLGQEYGLGPGTRDHEYASASPVAHEEATELVPGESVGGPQAVGELLD